MPCSRLLSSATSEVSEEPTCEAIVLEVFVWLYVCVQLGGFSQGWCSNQGAGNLCKKPCTEVWLHGCSLPTPDPTAIDY